MKTKSLKKIVYLLSLVIIASIIHSCEPDEKEDPINVNPRDKFLGTWLCTEQNKLTYTVNIVVSPDNSSNVLLKNFHHFGLNEHVVGEISGTTITSPSCICSAKTFAISLPNNFVGAKPCI